MKEYQNTKTKSKVEKVIKKVKNHMPNWKVIINRLIIELIKNVSLYKRTYFSEPYIHNRTNIKVELDLSKYAAS